jgi:ATP-dependent helicase HrpB
VPDPSPPLPSIPPTGLPIESCLDELRDALAEVGHAVLSARPGAGKTTVVPLRLLDEPWLDGRRIVMLEPRRLAARAAARRMAQLVGDAVGGLIGFQTRDQRAMSDRTRIEVVTEGILTRRLQNDPTLPGVAMVIFDEFHERSLPGDLGLAFALDARRGLRPDLRVLVMSATLDRDRIAELLGETLPNGPGPPAPQIAAEGREYPIDVQWRPRRQRDRLETAVVGAVTTALADAGDVLVFLPGAGEINRSAQALVASGLPPDVDVRPLFGALPAEEQDAAIAPCAPGRRKVVLATDIAETSLTVEGVTTVVDAGLARTPAHDAATGMTRLITTANSRASADQRAGRAGRTAPGVAIRLWSKMEHGTRPAFTVPDIAKVDLSGLALELAAWGADEPAELPFVDPPPEAAWRDALALLGRLHARDELGLTSVGSAMVRLPLHPRLARMVVGAEPTLAWTACAIAGLLAERDVMRGRPDEVPADLRIRLDLLADRDRSHPAAAGHAIARARQLARDIARRMDIPSGTIDVDAAGGLLSLAYPDRIGSPRGAARGRFRLRTGSGAWVATTDGLAGAELIVVADTDGKRKDARIRVGAPLTADELMRRHGEDVQVSSHLEWDKKRDDLVWRRRRTLDQLDLGIVVERPEPGPEVVDSLVDRARSTKLAVLGWKGPGRLLQARVRFLREHLGDEWPDLSDDVLLGELDDWLPAFLPQAVGRRDLEALDMDMVLRTRLDFDQQFDLDRLAPSHWSLPTGRSAPIDYDGEQPAIDARVQELFGERSHPTIADGVVPLLVRLLSPADRPVQITSDLPAFWTTSWEDVRKDMAGRYPKHDWPDDPGSARPHRR